MLELWVESEDIDKIIEDLSEEDLTRLEEAIWKRKQKDYIDLVNKFFDKYPTAKFFIGGVKIINQIDGFITSDDYDAKYIEQIAGIFGLNPDEELGNLVNDDNTTAWWWFHDKLETFGYHPTEKEVYENCSAGEGIASLIWRDGNKIELVKVKKND